MFEEQVAQVVQYTGLDIKRHDKPYMKRNDEKLNDRKNWPEGKNTNAVIIWTLDMEESLRTPLVKNLNTNFGNSLERMERDLATLRSEERNKPKGKGYVGFSRYNIDVQSLNFVFLHTEPVPVIQAALRLSRLSRLSQKNLQQPMLRVAAKDLITPSFGSEKIPSVWGYNMSQLTDFDKQFLRVLYGKHVNSGMILIKAKRLMFEELVDCFNAKTNTAKG